MKKLFLSLFVIALVVIPSYFLYYLQVNKQAEVQIERRVFCETLVPGMTQGEVLSSLKTFGEIKYNKTYIDESGYDEIVVGYPNIEKIYEPPGHRIFYVFKSSWAANLRIGIKSK
jgi:hypothetical protein